MPVPSSLDDLSTTPADNSPAGSESVFPNLDDYLRTVFAFIAQVRAGPILQTAMPDDFLTADENGRAKMQDGFVTPEKLAAAVLAGVAKPGDFKWRFTAEPDAGWLVCDGSAVSRTTYADLFDVIGTIFGDGDGSTTFNLPDLRGEFIRGWDKERGVDSGRAFGSAQSHALLAHNHTGTVNPNGLPGNLNVAGNDGLPDSGITLGPFSGTRPLSDFYATAHNHTVTINNYPGANETRPRNIALLPLIKY